MNFNKNLFETSEAKEFGEFEQLELGGHEVVILNAEEYKSELSGNISLRISIDISGNDKQAGFFKKQYLENKKNNPEAKWPVSATRYLSLKDENIAYLKGFITCLENSNSNFKFNKDGKWEQLKNLKCAGVFGLEEYKDEKGEIKTSTRLTQFRSLDKLSEIEIPSVKLLNGTYIKYSEYNSSSSVNNTNNEVEIPFDALPF